MSACAIQVLGIMIDSLLDPGLQMFDHTSAKLETSTWEFSPPATCHSTLLYNTFTFSNLRHCLHARIYSFVGRQFTGCLAGPGLNFFKWVHQEKTSLGEVSPRTAIYYSLRNICRKTYLPQPWYATLFTLAQNRTIHSLPSLQQRLEWNEFSKTSSLRLTNASIEK